MQPLSTAAIAELLQPFLLNSPGRIPDNLFLQLSTYLELLLRWNQRTNLTAIRDPAAIVVRHFGESLFLGGLLPPEGTTLLDLGSGAGFPGLPLQLLFPELSVTLAESQSRKAVFLREVIRVLGLRTVVLQERLTASPRELFSVVTLRAVDRMDLALAAAAGAGRRVLLLTTTRDISRHEVKAEKIAAVPGSRDRIAVLCVPRGTQHRPRFHVEQ